MSALEQRLQLRDEIIARLETTVGHRAGNDISDAA
tara:strand:- start:152 stop:256 length:105 start_codon:yes stop_codon:yes gene_type:complete